MPIPKFYFSYPVKTASDLSPFSSSKNLGEHILKQLRANGFNIFYDGDVKPGERRDVVERREFDTSDYIIAILAPDTLTTSTKVQDEMRRALLDTKKIIPLFIDGFSIADVNHLPPDFQAIRNLTGIVLDLNSIDTAIQQISTSIGITFQPPKPHLPTWLRNIAIGTLLTLLLTFLTLFPEKTRVDWFCKLRLISNDQCVTSDLRPQLTLTTESIPTVFLMDPITTPTIFSTLTLSMTELPSVAQSSSDISSSTTEVNIAGNNLSESNALAASQSQVLGFIPSESKTKYPCAASIVNINTSFQVHKRPDTDSELVPMIQSNEKVKIYSPVRTRKLGTIWYLISSLEDEPFGWIPAEYTRLEDNCPPPLSVDLSNSIPLPIGAKFTAVASTIPDDTLGLEFSGVAHQNLNLTLDRISNKLNIYVGLLYGNQILFQATLYGKSELITNYSLPYTANYILVVSALQNIDTVNTDTSTLIDRVRYNMIASLENK